MDLIEIDKKLQNEFAINKISVEKLAFNNILKAKSIPSYSKLDSLEKDIIYQIGLENSKEEKNNKLIKTLESQLAVVKENKEKVLKTIDLTPSDLVPKYSCTKCNDTGFYTHVMCECYKKRRNSAIIKECGFDEKELHSFNDINEKLFKNSTHLSDFNKLKQLLEKWCNAYPNVTKTNIVLGGATGIGKTFIMKCMAKTLIDKNLSICFLSAFEMNNLFLKYHTTFDKKKEQVLVPLLESDILFIDDLGSEPILNNVTSNYLYTTISERERFKRPTIISTNLSIDKIASRYDERIYSRLSNKQISITLNLAGDDLRTNS
ncbi:MAG: ATP-binding protein [Clostridia bacterium]|nr:ATP-binding protein [Clostridia bacterium]